jgi:adenosylcobinamide-GDP ribazoletransferase
MNCVIGNLRFSEFSPSLEKDLLNYSFMIQTFRQILQQLGGAIVFYTCLPIPHSLPLEFRGIAQWAPLIGISLGCCLGIGDYGLGQIGLPSPLRDVLIITIGLAVTGGLHLDGAMDAADGLAVLDPEKRLAVMADSRSGAFGVMAAIVILALKVTALMALGQSARFWVLPIAYGWGRWGQLAAIVRHPYLKKEGKGALHRAAIKSPWRAVPSLILMVGLCLWASPMTSVRLGVSLAIGGGLIGLAIGDWFNHKLGGQTGDTYGAIVEWTETLILVIATVLD